VQRPRSAQPLHRMIGIQLSLWLQPLHNIESAGLHHDLSRRQCTLRKDSPQLPQKWRYTRCPLSLLSAALLMNYSSLIALRLHSNILHGYESVSPSVRAVGSGGSGAGSRRGQAMRGLVFAMIYSGAFWLSLIASVTIHLIAHC
jgi:hypothetical protein